MHVYTLHPSWILGILWMVSGLGPIHGPRADVGGPAASAWPPVLVAFFQRKEVPLAASPAPAGPSTSYLAGPAGAAAAPGQAEPDSGSDRRNDSVRACEVASAGGQSAIDSE